MNDNQITDIRLLIIIGIAVMFLLITSFLLALIYSQRKKIKYQRSMDTLREQQQNQLIEAAVRSEELERHRISEILHDEVGAILSSAKLHLLGIRAEVLDEKDQRLHHKGRDLLNEVIQKVRGISHNLHSNVLREFGLNEAIRDFLKKLTRGSLVEADTKLDDRYQENREEEDISLYRIIQELLNNTLKYAAANKIQVSSVREKDTLQLTVYHNGNGLTQDQFEELRFRKQGLGLKNIQNRIILLKGSIYFHQDNDGYRVDIRVPVNKTVSHEKDSNRHSR